MSNSPIADRGSSVHQDYHDWGGRFRKMPAQRRGCFLALMSK